MKLTTNKKEKVFEPIELTITIESIDELRVFTSISASNITIPEMFSNENLSETASKMLNKIHKEVHPLFKERLNSLR